jgi:hypothetical protein
MSNPNRSAAKVHNLPLTTCRIMRLLDSISGRNAAIFCNSARAW